MKHVCPPDHKHASKSTCYTAHGCRCVPCGERTRRYKAFSRAAAARGVTLRGAVVDSRGGRRRLQALVAMGWGFDALGRVTGKTPQRMWKWAHGVAELSAESDAFVRDLYSRLSMTPPPRDTTAERNAASRAVAAGRRNGWVPPLAWDDIDLDDAPATAEAEPDVFDEAKVIQAVEAGLLGEQVAATFTVDERREVIRRMSARGLKQVEICARLNLSRSAVQWSLMTHGNDEREAA